MATFCKNCGKEVRDGERFCASCGTELSQQPAASETGEPVSETTSETSIGEPLTASAPPPSTAPPSRGPSDQQSPPPPTFPGSVQASGGWHHDGDKHFLGSLFDYSFSNLITARIVKVIYVLSTIIFALYSLLIVLVGFHISSAAGVLTLLIFAPLYFLISMIFVRVGLEVVLVFFHIRDKVNVISDHVTQSPISEAT